MKSLLMFCIMLSVALIASPASADGKGKALVEKHKCGSCHKMKGPAVKTIAEVMKRKAPDLFYAGSKFKEDWLEKFLQKPELLRPAGTVYFNHIKVDGDQDTIVGVKPCAAKLSEKDADEVAEYLMTLKDSSMKTGVAKIGKFKKARARVLMSKKEACNACHRFPKKGGGVSCPTFEGIGSRLNPDWLYSFIKDPQRWDPKVWMAKRDFSDTELQLMVNYLSSFK